ncbi:MAG: chromosome segregation protein SMC [Lachnospiraceae bacterium]
MYLKSIEIQGFKSFANRIVFEFHNGITGIVGPNGSGKSNVADAVRWVLGEQRAKQLRGESMQDVIFAGTENRKPLSYAHVAITLDNSDHKLPVDYEEVTVARRVYRSGESEYLLNGTACRLKDVNELFYDTGIGKEGYSIIGQGQIEQILNGKPEERRELFDEAAGIVKYKRRKAAAQKKLADERENLVRVTDILSEQEKQLKPLEQQSQTARAFLKKKEELKLYDVNLFLFEAERIEQERAQVEKKYALTEQELQNAKEEYEKTRQMYEKLEHEIEEIDQKHQTLQQEITQENLQKGQLDGQIEVLKEQIRSAERTSDQVEEQKANLQRQQEEKKTELESSVQKKEELQQQKQELQQELQRAETAHEEVKKVSDGYRSQIEACKTKMIELLNQKASVKAGQQRYDTMLEQINIRKAQLTKQLLQRKTDEQNIEQAVAEYEQALQKTQDTIAELTKNKREMEEKRFEWKQKQEVEQQKSETLRREWQKNQSRLETLQNIAERYDGYGNSIQQVMKQKEHEPGILGVVADLIQVPKKYETAIETALGGSIRNIVTEEEETAKRMIGFLKKNRYGRATFLPLTSVGKRKNNRPVDVSKEAGVIGRANTLIHTEERFLGIMEYLLGRTIVVDTLDHATDLARAHQYSLHIVTLEGESLSPGGSMTGGAFKNSNNLLGRKRELDELSEKIKRQQEDLQRIKERLDDIETARVLLKEDLNQTSEELQNAYLEQNTAKINLERAQEQKEQTSNVYQSLKVENKELDEQMAEIHEQKEHILNQILEAQEKEAALQEENRVCQEKLQTQTQAETECAKAVTDIQMQMSALKQQEGFLQENQKRAQEELQRLKTQEQQLESTKSAAKEDVEQKKQEIQQMKQTIEQAAETIEKKKVLLTELIQQKEEKRGTHKQFFEKREQVSEHRNALEKETFRLNSQKEKLDQQEETQTGYMWEEYELTLHAAKELKQEGYQDAAELKQKIRQVKEEIRRLGNVNVNAIDQYKELSERYEFLKNQHDDLIEAEKKLMQVIEELDDGMRRQFKEKFAEIQVEFNQVFKELFGGGKGTLELVDEEDILECGIRIIAQPPGKKLQNMMQMSGGEKSLTAIALLFSIQNLKPSPFCLLDEIEAALDDSNVTRFAKYLGKLTRNTQFIVITHRRGSMEAADRLYGITMQEKGVSTLVSVNLIENDLDK